MPQALRSFGLVSERREGEQELGLDPVTLACDGHVVFIGRMPEATVRRTEQI